MPTAITAISLGANELVDFSQTLDWTKLIVKTTTVAYIVTVATNSAVLIASNYPAVTVRGIVYLDGTFYVMDPYGVIYGSDIDTPETWGALNFISANSEPDGAVAIGKINQYVVAFGNYSIDFFYDAGNATGSPLSQVQNGSLQYGCANGNSIAYANAMFYFASNSKAQGQAASAGFQIARLNGLQYEKISTDSIERILNNDGLTICYGSAVTILAHNFYILSLPNSNVTLAYDIDIKQWYYFTTQAAFSITLTTLTSATNVDGTTVTATATKAGHGLSDGDPITISGANEGGYNISTNVTVVSSSVFKYQVPSIPSTPATGTIVATGYTPTYLPIISACEFSGKQIFQSTADGLIYNISDTLYTDNNNYVDAHIRTGRIDNEKNQAKFLAWMDVVTDRSANNALVRYTDDDYQTYSAYRKVSLSGKRSRLNRQGSFKRRAFEIRVTDNAAFRFQGLDLALEEGIE